MQSKITKISAQKRRGRFNIFVDGHYAFPVGENVLIRYQLVKDMEIDQQLVDQLVDADLRDQVYQKAVNYLATQLRTTVEVRQKIETETDNEAIIEFVIQRLRENQLLDDQNYADCYVRTQVNAQDKGPVAIEQHLRQRGIDNELIVNALANNYPPTEVVDNGLHQAQKMFKRYHRKAFADALNKVKAGLARKGYPFDIIEQVMDAADFEPDDDAQEMLLREQFERAWHRYRQYSPFERRFKVKQTLYRKGFNMDSINRLIDAQLEN